MAEETSSENVTAEEAEQVTEQKPEIDPFGIPMDELKTKIESEIFAEPETPAVEAEAEAPSDDTPAEVSEPEAETADETVTKAADAEVTESDELRAMFEESQAQSKHFESLLGAQTGKEGFFQKKVQDLETRLSQVQQGQTSDEFVEPAPTPQAAPPKPVSDQNTAYLVGLAIKGAGEAFLAQTPGVVLKDNDGKTQVDPNTGNAALDPEFASAAAGVGAQIEQLLQWSDPISAGQEASRLLSSAWARADLTKKRATRVEIQRRRVDQAARLKSKKRASASASTGAAPPRPKAREVDPHSIPMDELKKLAEKEAEEAGL